MSGKSSIELIDKRAMRVLACDDSLVNLAMLRRILEREGYSVATVQSGEEAMEEIDRRGFDLVLMDIMMTGMDGIEVCKLLRSRQSNRACIPIIMLTASSEKEARVRALKAGATDFLLKPFDPTELLARIYNHIAAKRLHDRVVAINKELEDEQSKVIKVQRGLLPSSFPTNSGLRFGGGYKPSSMVGGDYYDTFIHPDGRVILAIGDISGHGISSAMHMGTLRATLHAEVEAGSDIATIMRGLNRILTHCLDNFSFVTFFLALLDPVTLRVECASAGHMNPLVHDLESDTVAEIEIPSTYPLGIEKNDFVVPVSEFTLKPRQRLVLFTDGILEQRNSDDEFFEAEGLHEALRRQLKSHVEFLPMILLHELDLFMEGVDQADDLSLLIVETPVTLPSPEA